MSDSMTEWIAAYFDGELSADRRAWVEDHLALCADCRRQLEELHELSALLQDFSVSTSPISNQAFAAQVLRRLPRVKPPFGSRVARSGLRYAPLGLFGIWAFIQAVLIVSGVLLLLINYVPAMGGAVSDLSPSLVSPVSMSIISWFEFISLPLYTLALEWLAWLSPLIVLELITTLIFAALYLVWILGMWSYQRSSTTQSTTQFE